MIAESFSRGWHAFTRRWVALLAPSLLILVVAIPINGMASMVGGAIETMAKIIEEATPKDKQGQPVIGQNNLNQEQTQRLLGALTPCCGGMCGDLLLTVFLLAPVVAGASISAAQTVEGRTGNPHLMAGFRRYGTVIWVGTLCLILGGGIGVLASTVASIGARAGVSAAGHAAGMSAGPVVEATYWFVVALMLGSIMWFSTRLWFALYRLLDPTLERATARQSIAWSWMVSKGIVQWQVLGVLLVLGLIAGALQIPSQYLLVQESESLQWAGVALSGAVALLVWVPLSLAVSGAMYSVVSKVEVQPAT